MTVVNLLDTQIALVEADEGIATIPSYAVLLRKVHLRSWHPSCHQRHPSDQPTTHSKQRRARFVDAFCDIPGMSSKDANVRGMTDRRGRARSSSVRSHARYPPSTVKVAPVTKLASGPARKATIAATSSA